MQQLDKYKTLRVIQFVPDEKVLTILLNANNSSIQRWYRREGDLEWISIGSAIRLYSADAAQHVLRTITKDDPEAAELLRCFTVLPFDREEWNRRLRWIYPKWTLVRKNNKWHGFGIKRKTTQEYDPQKELNILTKTVIGGPIHHSDKSTLSKVEFSREDWITAINNIRNRIRTTMLRKVVLARSEHIVTPFVPIVDRVFEILKSNNPNCDCFLFPVEDGWFLGATPERLCRIVNNTVEVDALAGTRPRGLTQSEDEKLEQELLSSEKENWEQGIVVDWIVDRLTGLCGKLQYDETPSIKKFATVQHLFTSITGKMKVNTTLDNIINALHPTPAIGGDPQDEALAVLREVEKCHRGYYSGIVGAVGCKEAEFSVAIRSMFVAENTATFYAGTGIVELSDPVQEWEETRWKMSAMKQAINKALHVTDE